MKLVKVGSKQFQKLCVKQNALVQNHALSLRLLRWREPSRGVAVKHSLRGTFSPLPWSPLSEHENAAEDTPPRVELHFNPRHAVIKHLAAARDAKPDMAKLMAEQVLDNALIAAGLLDDPQKMVARIYKLLESV